MIYSWFSQFSNKSLWNSFDYIIRRIYRSLFIKVWASRFDNRLFVSDLNCCKSFFRLWFASLHYFLSTRSKSHEICKFHESTIVDRLVNELKIVIFEYDSLNRILEKFAIENDDEKKEMKKKDWKCLYTEDHFRIQTSLIAATTTTLIDDDEQ